MDTIKQTIIGKGYGYNGVLISCPACGGGAMESNHKCIPSNGFRDFEALEAASEPPAELMIGNGDLAFAHAFRVGTIGMGL